MNIDAIEAEALERAAMRAVGTLFTWRELFGPDRWDAFPRVNEIGRLLKARALADELAGIQWVGKNAQNSNVYRRV